MITRLQATEFNRPMKSGKTAPLLITGEDTEGQLVEVVAKYSSGCERREIGLAMEVIAACLAGDLGLPVPQPFTVETTPEWIGLIPDEAIRARLEASSPIAFGSRLLTPQYLPWHGGTALPGFLVQTAAEVLVFDAIVQNPDRRAENPNCLVRGDEIRIIDHELAFSHGLVIGWVPPWQAGGLKPLETPGHHIFMDRLKGRDIDFNVIRDAWAALPDAHLADYAAAVPDAWKTDAQEIARALNLIRDARDNIDGCIAEVKRVLT
jgi:hypothetical protein